MKEKNGQKDIMKKIFQILIKKKLLIKNLLIKK